MPNMWGRWASNSSARWVTSVLRRGAHQRRSRHLRSFHAALTNPEKHARPLPLVDRRVPQKAYEEFAQLHAEPAGEKWAACIAIRKGIKTDHVLAPQRNALAHVGEAQWLRLAAAQYLAQAVRGVSAGDRRGERCHAHVQDGLIGGDRGVAEGEYVGVRDRAHKRVHQHLVESIHRQTSLRGERRRAEASTPDANVERNRFTAGGEQRIRIYSRYRTRATHHHSKLAEPLVDVLA